MFQGGTPRGKRIPPGSTCLGGMRTRLLHPRVVVILPPVVATTNKERQRKTCSGREQGPAKEGAGRVGGDVALVGILCPVDWSGIVV